MDLNGLNDLDSLISLKNLLILMVWSSLAPKWPIPVPFCGMDHQKSNFSLISDTLSVGGCWGQPMSFFWKVVDETQISKPLEGTRHHNLIKLLIFLPLRANFLYILRYETPCRSNNRSKIKSKYIFFFSEYPRESIRVIKQANTSVEDFKLLTTILW